MLSAFDLTLIFRNKGFCVKTYIIVRNNRLKLFSNPYFFYLINIA